MARMLTQQRKSHILDLLRRDGQVVAKRLSAELLLSEDTIRRDLRELARDGLNPDLGWLGVVFNIADMRTRHSREAYDTLRKHVGRKLLETTIRSSIAYAEAAERAISILDHRPDLGADYLDVAAEVLQRLPGRTAAGERLALLR